MAKGYPSHEKPHYPHHMYDLPQMILKGGKEIRTKGRNISDYSQLPTGCE